LNLQDVQVWSALDEPLFKHFGSDKIIQMMKQLGMKEDVAIEHNMISKAIQNAQEKISKKVLIDQAASSQEEWLKKNWAS
jgi:preprotein translocase subunit SecA